ncbi:MAG TPA: HEAT repeat domain-containing protein [Thermoguttaceae bacterium]|nr:HEAT repeat domain-containing protein [Thermoguttaceae bacterium]
MRVERDLLIERLIERLQDASPLNRRNAAGALRLHGERAASAVPAITQLLDDPSPMVRAEARRALERLAGCIKVA